jgi:hypothetical protein
MMVQFGKIDVARVLVCAILLGIGLFIFSTGDNFDYLLNSYSHYSKVTTPDDLYLVAFERYKNGDKGGLKKISCPVFGSPDSDFNYNWFDKFYTGLQNYEFNNVIFTKNNDQRYFSISNVISQGKQKTIRIQYSEIYPRVVVPVQSHYCLVASVVEV